MDIAPPVKFHIYATYTTISIGYNLRYLSCSVKMCTHITNEIIIKHTNTEKHNISHLSIDSKICTNIHLKSRKKSQINNKLSRNANVAWFWPVGGKILPCCRPREQRLPASGIMAFVPLSLAKTPKYGQSIIWKVVRLFLCALDLRRFKWIRLIRKERELENFRRLFIFLIRESS